MKSKVVIADWGIYSHRAIFSAFKNPGVPATYTALAMMLGNLKRIGIAKSDKIIVACDGRGNWRKEVDTTYKADRAQKRKESPINWNEEFDKMNRLLQTLDFATNWHIVRLPKIEADDIMATATRLYTDSEIVLCTYDSDLEQMFQYNNVKIFSPMTKRYKIKPANFSVYKLLAKKIRKETSDNLVSPILNKEQYENRMKIVDLLHLPEWVEQSIIAELESLEDKVGNLDLIPFKSLRARFETLYNQDKVVSYEKCVKYYERKKRRKK